MRNEKFGNMTEVEVEVEVESGWELSYWYSVFDDHLLFLFGNQIYEIKT